MQCKMRQFYNRKETALNYMASYKVNVVSDTVVGQPAQIKGLVPQYPTLQPVMTHYTPAYL